jgi:acetolactate decarboxylase
LGSGPPSYTRTINVPGYHLHRLTDDRQDAGHVLDLQCDQIEVDLLREDALHLALPETPAFLKADLSGDPAAALAIAKSKHS